MNNFLKIKNITRIKANKKRGKVLALSTVRTILIAGLAFIILYPIFIKLSASFKSIDDMFDPTVIFIPKNPTFDNFKLVFNAVNYPKIFATTILICTLLSIFQVASCTLVSYGLARFNFPFKKIIFILVIFTLIVPPQTILMPLYLKFRFFNIFQILNFTGSISGGFNLVDTVWPFVLLSLFSVAFKNGLFIFMLRQYFVNIPVVLEEAASIDGCGIFKTFYKVTLPGALPMLVTVFLFSFVWQWNDFYYVNVLAPNLPLLSTKMMGLNFSTLGASMDNIYASILNSPKFILLIIPLVILYLFTQKFFVQSIEKSGIVG